MNLGLPFFKQEYKYVEISKLICFKVNMYENLFYKKRIIQKNNFDIFQQLYGLQFFLIRKDKYALVVKDKQLEVRLCHYIIGQY